MFQFDFDGPMLKSLCYFLADVVLQIAEPLVLHILNSAEHSSVEMRLFYSIIILFILRFFTWLYIGIDTQNKNKLYPNGSKWDDYKSKSKKKKEWKR